MKPHRRPHGALLGRRRRRKVHAQTKAVVQQIQHGAGSSTGSAGRHAPGSLTQLRRTLHDVREEVVRDGAGRHTKLVASALGDLDHTLATLTRSYGEHDPNAKLRLLADAKQALDRAEAKARKAGHDWPL